MMTDPVADLLTRLRNAYAIGRREIEMPTSKLRRSLAEALKREGFLETVAEIEGAPRNRLRLGLRYGERGEPAVRHLRRVSTPGRRRYVHIVDLRRVAGGVGIAVLTTSRGVLSDREAHAKNVGGEILCEVW